MKMLRAHAYLNSFFWWFWIYVIRAGGLVFLLSPLKLPDHEREKLQAAAVHSDILIVFHPGGWGDATLEQANDFTPILAGIRQTLTSLGYKTGVVQYTRTLPNLTGRISGTKEQLLSFKNSSRLLVRDIRSLVESFPQKRFILAGFSTGGGLTGKAMKQMTDCSSVYGIMVGVPGWFPTHRSRRSLVIDNSGRDPISCGRVNTIAVTVFRAPVIWMYAKVRGRELSLPLALQFPDHEYTWSSPEVGRPIMKFLKANFNSSEKA